VGFGYLVDVVAYFAYYPQYFFVIIYRFFIQNSGRFFQQNNSDKVAHAVVCFTLYVR
jgi:hypothetical protein